MPPAPLELVGALAVLAATVVAGMVAHELSHALALEAFGVPYDLEFLPDRDAAGLLQAGVRGTWATVTPTALPGNLSAWRLRTAAVMPFVLAVPFALVAVGVVPDPVALGDPLATAAAIGWLACALPSPQDFSLLWYPERAIDEFAAGTDYEGGE